MNIRSFTRRQKKPPPRIEAAVFRSVIREAIDYLGNVSEAWQQEERKALWMKRHTHSD